MFIFRSMVRYFKPESYSYPPYTYHLHFWHSASESSSSLSADSLELRACTVPSVKVSDNFHSPTEKVPFSSCSVPRREFGPVLFVFVTSQLVIYPVSGGRCNRSRDQTNRLSARVFRKTRNFQWWLRRQANFEIRAQREKWPIRTGRDVWELTSISVLATRTTMIAGKE